MKEQKKVLKHLENYQPTHNFNYSFEWNKKVRIGFSLPRKLGLSATIQGINFSIIVATEFTLIFVRAGAFSRDKPVKKDWQ